jgi:hypothetical protein
MNPIIFILAWTLFGALLYTLWEIRKSNFFFLGCVLSAMCGTVFASLTMCIIDARWNNREFLGSGTVIGTNWESARNFSTEPKGALVRSKDNIIEAQTTAKEGTQVDIYLRKGILFGFIIQYEAMELTCPFDPK